MNEQKSDEFKLNRGALIGAPVVFLVAFLLPYVSPKITLCTFKLATGLDCPGCGITRSLIAFVHGHLVESVKLHALGVMFAILLLYLFIRQSIEMMLQARLPDLLGHKGKRIVAVGIAVALVIPWLIKIYAHAVCLYDFGK